MKNVILIVLSMLLFSCSTDNGKHKVPEIEVYQVTEKNIPVFEEYVGQIYGAKDIAIRARVEGVLTGIHFKEGSSVKKGRLLYTIDAQPYEAEAAEKMSGVAESKTRLAKALSDLNRIKPLAEQKAVSQSDLDGAIAQYEAAKSSVEAANAVLRASQIQLGYTKIYAPISGVIGRTKAKVGDFVGKDPNPVILNTVSDISSVLVQFFITEEQYLFVRRFSLSKKFENRNNRPADDLQLILSDDSYYNHKGKFDFIDREVDSQTGAMLVQASFPNPEQLLRPGQYAKVRIRVDVVENGLIIPQRSLSELQGTFRVDVVNGENKIEKRAVEVGVTVGNFRIVKSGLKSGDKIVYEGLQKVRPGMPVNPVVVDVKHITNENGNNNE